jgi:hypothetical protein
MQYVFLNTIVIPLVYTEKIFSSVYLQTCFTVDNVISKSDMSSYYLTFFSFIIFLLKFPWYILREFFYWYLPINTKIKNSIGKGYRNIPKN